VVACLLFLQATLTLHGFLLHTDATQQSPLDCITYHFNGPDAGAVGAALCAVSWLGRSFPAASVLHTHTYSHALSHLRRPSYAQPAGSQTLQQQQRVQPRQHGKQQQLQKHLQEQHQAEALQQQQQQLELHMQEQPLLHHWDIQQQQQQQLQHHHLGVEPQQLVQQVEELDRAVNVPQQRQRQKQQRRLSGHVAGPSSSGSSSRHVAVPANGNGRHSTFTAAAVQPAAASPRSSAQTQQRRRQQQQEQQQQQQQLGVMGLWNT
jgi:hypothetical protein